MSDLLKLSNESRVFNDFVIKEANITRLELYNFIVALIHNRVRDFVSKRNCCNNRDDKMDLFNKIMNKASKYSRNVQYEITGQIDEYEFFIKSARYLNELIDASLLIIPNENKEEPFVSLTVQSFYFEIMSEADKMALVTFMEIEERIKFLKQDNSIIEMSLKY
jgi:hypothetical protein